MNSKELTLNNPTKDEILSELKKFQSKYKENGFLVIGLFGSYVRGDFSDRSDIDILYQSTSELESKFSGWEIFNFVEQIKKEMETKLLKKIDLVDIDGLNSIGKKYILAEVLYV